MSTVDVILPGAGQPIAVVDIGAATAAAVTITIASPGVVTDTGHSYQDGQPLSLTTTGALPTGLTAGTQYFVKSPVAGVSYNLALTSGGTAINTTGTQSGTHTRQAVILAQLVQLNNVNGNGATAAAASAPVVLANDTGLLAVAHTAAPTAKTDGQVVPFVADKVGRLVVVPAIRDLVASSGVVTVSTTAETTLMAAVASTFLDMTAIKLVNTSVTGVRVDLRDTTGGTVVDTWYLPPTDDRGQSYPVPRKQTSVNTNWTIQLSGAVTDVRVVADFIKNI